MNKIIHHSIANLIVIPNIINKISNCKAIKSYSVLKFINLKLRNTQNILYQTVLKAYCCMIFIFYILELVRAIYPFFYAHAKSKIRLMKVWLFESLRLISTNSTFLDRWQCSKEFIKLPYVGETLFSNKLLCNMLCFVQ